MAYAFNKVDKNQKDVVKALRDYGADVFLLHTVGGGIPDLLVCFEEQTILMEVKDGSEKKLTPQQITLFANWKGGHLYRVNSVQEALEVLKFVKMESENE
jgi:Holliday junction resolvase